MDFAEWVMHQVGRIPMPLKAVERATNIVSVSYPCTALKRMVDVAVIVNGKTIDGAPLVFFRSLSASVRRDAVWLPALVQELLARNDIALHARWSMVDEKPDVVDFYAAAIASGATCIDETFALLLGAVAQEFGELEGICRRLASIAKIEGGAVPIALPPIPVEPYDRVEIDPDAFAATVGRLARSIGLPEPEVVVPNCLRLPAPPAERALGRLNFTPSGRSPAGRTILQFDCKGIGLKIDPDDHSRLEHVLLGRTGNRGWGWWAVEEPQQLPGARLYSIRASTVLETCDADEFKTIIAVLFSEWSHVDEILLSVMPDLLTP